MFMRRGCLFGCFGWLIACVAVGLLAWFLVIPRIGDSLQDGVSEGISTVIADQVDPFHSRTELQGGTDVRFSFATINRELQAAASDEDDIDQMMITSSGNRIVIRAEFTNQSFEFGFTPVVTADGQLEMQPDDDGGWWQQQFTGILGGGFERAINEWLDRNDLRLTNIELDGDTLILSVTGK